MTIATQSLAKRCRGFGGSSVLLSKALLIRNVPLIPQVVFSYLLGITVLGEGLSLPGAAGASAVALGVFFVASEPRNLPQPKYG